MCDCPIFGRVREDGNVAVLYACDGSAVTRLDASVYPVWSSLSVRYGHAQGIVLSRADAALIGLELES